MAVPLPDLEAQYRPLRDQLIAAMTRVGDSLAIPIYCELTLTEQETVVCAIGEFVHEKIGAVR
jgi:hypothetical protein